MPDDWNADASRLWRYAERFFQRSGRTEFPSVRRAARSLGLRQSRILELVEGTDGLMLTGYGEEVVDADLTIETF